MSAFAQTPASDMLRRLHNSIVPKPPYASGTIPAKSDDLLLYFGQTKDSTRLDFASLSPEELGALSTACEPAPFGVNNQNVVDDTYRKAGKLDTAFFSTAFVPERTQLIDIIRNNLLEGKDSDRPLDIELYKLNIYGEGSFFKPHKDTPQSKSMFGSLVVVFPTAHEGGALVLRNKGEEWTFDSAKALADSPAPSLAFITFFSDVEHEVLPVTTGHRVTLTYNLFYADMSTDGKKSSDIKAHASAPPANEASFRSVLEELLEDPNFLPDGGTLGFGLRHVYPVNHNNSSLSHVYKLLKGTDGVIYRVCTDLSLEATLYLAYEDSLDDWGRMHRESAEDNQEEEIGIVLDRKDPLLIMSNIPDLSIQEEEGVSLQDRAGGSIVYHPDPEQTVDERVHWVTAPESPTQVETPMLFYGNEASVSFIYADLCLIVRVGEPGSR